MSWPAIIVRFLPLFFAITYAGSGGWAQGSTGVDRQPFAIGETVQLQSKVLNETRTLNIYLPQGYDERGDQAYPVIYLLDGSADEDFIHVSGLTQFLSFPWINTVPELIVVGIGNVDRKRDFTFPTTVEKDQEDFPTAGHSAEFIRFLQTELQPFINSEYRTAPGTTLIGQSLGGLLATEILVTQPDLFDNYLIVSPSLWWDNESLLSRKFEPISVRKNVFVAVGKEGEVMERLAHQLFETLVEANPGHTRIHFQSFDKRDHGDALHEAVYEGLGVIFEKE